MAASYPALIYEYGKLPHIYQHDVSTLFTAFLVISFASFCSNKPIFCR